ncbi:MAG: alpha/beta hydrolase [Symploca sp. SIO2E6]|nr:alpha/beta hydrolase [Symploca sp. SIO2E6]
MKSLFSREQVDDNGSFQEHHRLREQHVEEFGFNLAPRSLTAQTDDGLNAFITSVGQERLQELATGEASGGMPPQVLPMAESELEQNLDLAIDSLISYFKSGQFGEFECPFKDYKKQPIVCRYAAFLPPNNVPIKRVLHFCNGRTESLLKNLQTVYALRELRGAGLALVMMDHPGQGFSSRYLRDPFKGFARDFDELIKAQKIFESIIRPQLIKHNQSLGYESGFTYRVGGHSMGSGVATRLLQEYPNLADDWLFMSPMHDIETPFDLKIDQFGILEQIAARILKFIDILDRDFDYVPGSKPGYSPNRLPTKENSGINKVTTSSLQTILINKISERYPGLTLGAPTIVWFKESITECQKMRNKAGILREAIASGKHLTVLRPTGEQIVGKKGQDQLYELVGEGMKVIDVDGEPKPQHEILIESPQIQHQAFKWLAEFAWGDGSLVASGPRTLEWV